MVVIFLSGAAPGILGKSVALPDVDHQGIAATGLKDPTAAQEEWMRENFPVIERIRLNSLALERINAERAARGLGRLSGSEVGVAPFGWEAAYASEAVSADPEMVLALDPYSVLPSSVDNSLLSAFPPIRSQGSIGSCVAWATTYYQFTYETNLARGRTASNGDNSMIFSPKWTYNMINYGVDGGAYFSDAYALLLKHGAVSWSEFPYDSNYLEWCLNVSAWRNAINYRPLSWGQIYNSNTTQMIADLKTQLANGHVLVFGTYVYSWVQSYVVDDSSTRDDDAFVGQKIATYMKNTRLGGHAMTIVGYNDNIWCDLNGNKVVDPGEKGAFKVANSWGTSDWNGGFRWVAYDALYPSSVVKASGTWPTTDRSTTGILMSGAYTLTARTSYAPTMVAEFTLSHLKRGQLAITLGIGDTANTAPSWKWTPEAIYYSGGNYAFDGTTSICDATFVFDFTDLVNYAPASSRWFLEAYDKTSGDPATVKAYRLYKVDATGDRLVGSCSSLPLSVDAGQLYVWIDNTSKIENLAPTARVVANPTSGYAPLAVSFDGSGSSDPDGKIVSYSWDFGDGYTGTGATVTHTYTAKGTYTARLTVADDKGATATASVTVMVDTQTTLTLNPPTNLKAVGGSGYARLTWTDNSNNEEGFYIERAVWYKNKYTEYVRIATVGPNTTSFVDTTAPSGSCKYRVQAFSTSLGIVSGYSNAVSVRVK
ncbi:MAG: PKD domain-containing protein [Candidatus Methanosuratincola sp.]|nr:PKD domain-containing protein [Candidatus Methanosuratincola sp.]